VRGRNARGRALKSAETQSANREALRRRRTIVIRGELFSDTGYSRAARALASVLSAHCEHLFGVSLHEHASRRFNSFAHVVIREEEISRCVQDGGEVVNVNVCLPEHFIYVPGAVNVGYFFWETEQFPLAAFWLTRLKLMDRVWAPSSWQSEFMCEVMRCRDIPVVPWPQVASTTPDASVRARLSPVRAHREMGLDEARNYHLRASPPGAREVEKIAEQHAFDAGVNHRFDPGLSRSVTDILTSPGDVFLSIQTDAPRKGLPMLFTAWLLFKQRDEGGRAKLLVKLSSIDVEADLYRIHFHASLALMRAKARFGVDDPGVWFIYDRLENDELEALIVSCDALISATYGEGFGGPIAEALTHGVPVIAPNHTSLRDLLGKDYPLAVKCDSHAMALWQNISVYSPSSVWHLPDEQDFAEKLRQFVAMSGGARKTLGMKTRDDLLERTGVEQTMRILAAEFEKISQLWADARMAETGLARTTPRTGDCTASGRGLHGASTT